MEQELVIKDLHVEVDGKEILKGVNLVVRKGEVNALMGPNGAGKSSLGLTIIGHPKYKITKGYITYKGEDITKLSVDKRARLGLFLSFQYPSEISGVTISNFLRTAINSRREDKIDVLNFIKILKEKMKLLKIDESFISRYLNEGFSGGEKKRMEILQMAMLNPEIAILDETDSGTDVDALKVIANGINSLLNPNVGVLLITHYNRILEYIKPDKVHVMVDGKIVKSGDYNLAVEIEENGYEVLEE